MTRGCPAVVGAWLLVAALLAAGCGSRGSPLPPLRIVPATITPVEVTRLGDRVYVEFVAPEEDSDGTTPGDIIRVEVYAVTTQPELRQPRPPVDEDWFDAATLVATFDVEPPDAAQSPDDATGVSTLPEDAAEGALAPAPVVAQGDDVTVVERLTPETLVPVIIGEPDDEDEEEDDDEDEPVRQVPRPVVAPPFEPLPIRSYVAVAISSRERMGDPSAIADLPLTDPPAPPSGLPVVTYTEESVDVTWTQPPTFRRPVHVESPEPPLLVSRAVLEWPRGSEYAVYDQAAWDPDAERPEPLASPGDEPTLTEDSVVFGETRCYAVRVVDYVGTTPVAGPASLANCVVPVDTFPPAAPTGLIAVADGNGISLVWDPNGEEDLAGYVVLRGTAPDATLQRLSAGPVVATAFQDTRVAPGERYVYRVQALDGSIPPNVSPPSEAVAETAR
ncbi:MAG: fibronectin type III domain-containing protein [Acidobacteria bacterium]|nr:fibronectin type III domain-containing protein [Acidobacteriota bacterium]